jgi:glutathione S-transferase
MFQCLNTSVLLTCANHRWVENTGKRILNAVELIGSIPSKDLNGASRRHFSSTEFCRRLFVRSSCRNPKKCSRIIMNVTMTRKFANINTSRCACIQSQNPLPLRISFSNIICTIASSMLLYASDFTYFPRRVLIYLEEKKFESGMITKVPTWFTPDRTTESSLDFPPKPAGSIPILAIRNGKEGQFVYIRQSLAILNYLEDLAEDSNSRLKACTPSMRGTTPLEKARVAELLALLDECCITFAYWCVFGAFTFPQTTNVAAAQVTKRCLFMRLATIESYMSDRDLSFCDRWPESHDLCP